ncbi:MAG: hypothetical protein QGG36_30820 [Pirellulaceae bacterium]|jgi:hypothetical protein|nr:hypothetical protein [Pirellulaceae bacterium]MDP7020231.1 hypothetical protein [Pirellulaceae bacterium]
MNKSNRPLRSYPAYAFALATLLVTAIGSLNSPPPPVTANTISCVIAVAREVNPDGIVDVTAEDVQVAWSHAIASSSGSGSAELRAATIDLDGILARLRTKATASTGDFDRIQIDLASQNSARDAKLLDHLAQRLVTRWNMTAAGDEHRRRLYDTVEQLRNATEVQSELRDSLREFASEQLLAQAKSNSQREPELLPNPDWISTAKRLDERQFELDLARSDLQDQHPRISKLVSEVEVLRSRLTSLPREIDAEQLASGGFKFVQPAPAPVGSQFASATRRASSEASIDPLVLEQFARLSTMLEKAAARRNTVESALREVTSAPTDLREVAWVEQHGVAAATAGATIKFYGWIVAAFAIVVASTFAAWGAMTYRQRESRPTQRQVYNALLLGGEIVLVMVALSLHLR